MAKREETDEFIWQTEAIKIGRIWHDVERKPERRCAEMVRAAMSAAFKNERQGYLSAAQWFALAAKEDDDARFA